MSAPTILLVNHWHDDNKGDGAISAATVGLLQARYPDAHIRVVGLLENIGDGGRVAFRHLTSTYPDVSVEAAWLPSEHSTRTRWPKVGARPASLAWLARTAPWALSVATGVIPASVRARLRDVDLVVAMGGSNIYDDPSVMAPATWARLVSVTYVPWAAQRLGIPVVGLGHTLGPFPRRLGRALAAKTLRDVVTLGVRDPKSHTLGASLGLNVDLAPDTAFALGTRPTRRVEEITGRMAAPMGRSLLVLPRQHPSAGAEADSRFLGEVATLCRRLVSSGTIDQVVVGAHCLGPTSIEDDRRSVDELLTLLVGLPVEHLDVDLAPQEQVALYGQALVTLSVRLHGSILAMVGGSPAFTVAYFSTKAEGAMADAGLPDAWVGFEHFATDKVAPVIEGLASRSTRDRLAERIQSLNADLAGRPAAWPDVAGAELSGGDRRIDVRGGRRALRIRD